MYNTQLTYQLSSYIKIEAIDELTLALYNDKYATTELVARTYEWLFDLLIQPTSLLDIEKAFSVTYPDLHPEDASEQLPIIIQTFTDNRILTQVAHISES